MRRSFDVVVVGGGVVGSSCAYFLASCGLVRPERIAVVERDSSYKFASSARSASSIRQQFSTRENILVSQFGLEFLRNVDTHLGLDDERDQPIDLAFTEQGYLFLRSVEDDKEQIHKSLDLQVSLGADIEFIPANRLVDKFPWINPEGLYGGTFGRSGEGWFDAYGLMMAFRRKARELGVEYIENHVSGVSIAGGHGEFVETCDGQQIEFGSLVNAAGPRAFLIAEMTGLSYKEFPVSPRKRSVFGFRVQENEHSSSLLKAPLTIDPSGVYFRPDQNEFISGWSPPDSEDEDAPFDSEEADHDLWEGMIWPTLAERVKCMEASRVLHSWAGLYSVNTFDHNAIVGRHPMLSNVYFANGFSGHGLQQAPAVGRGIQELITHGRYQSIDLSSFGFERMQQNRGKAETNVV